MEVFVHHCRVRLDWRKFVGALSAQEHDLRVLLTLLPRIVRTIHQLELWPTIELVVSWVQLIPQHGSLDMALHYTSGDCLTRVLLVLFGLEELLPHAKVVQVDFAIGERTGRLVVNKPFRIAIWVVLRQRSLVRARVKLDLLLRNVPTHGFVDFVSFKDEFLKALRLLWISQSHLS